MTDRPTGYLKTRLLYLQPNQWHYDALADLAAADGVAMRTEAMILLVKAIRRETKKRAAR